MTVLAFGHGLPLSDPALAGLALRDITRLFHPEPPHSRIAPLLEPFLDPYARSFLFGLETGAFAGAALILVWRGGPGALHAYRYGAELRRLGLLPPGPPLHLWNTATGPGAAARQFNETERARLETRLAGLQRGNPQDFAGPSQALAALQLAGGIDGATAQTRRLTARATGTPVETSVPLRPPPPGRRLALAGAPLGNSALQHWVEAQGRLVLDLTGPDAPPGDPADLIARHRIDALFWQVDPHDDLHGWRMPSLRDGCAPLGVVFHDLGFVPAWPGPADIARLTVPA